jgi:hypothetical protein
MMRIRGGHIVLTMLSALALAGCGSEATDEATGGGVGNNLPPIITGTPPTSLAAGTTYLFTPQASDPNGDALTFSASGLPGWANINSSTGTVTGTPQEADVGMTPMITIMVSDTKATTELPAFRISVAGNSSPPPSNTAPTIAGTPPTSASVGQVYTFTPVGDDAEDDTLTFSIQNMPSWATFTPATGQLTGTPSAANVGTFNNIIISVSDGTTSTSVASFNITVAATAPANRAPTISGTPATSVVAGSAYSFRPVASDPDGNTLTWSIQNKPSWATFSSTTGRLSGTPTTAHVGTSARITITVSDATLSASLPSFTIQVTAPANRAPVISGTPSLSVTIGVLYSFTPTASDPDGNTLSFTIQNKPAWATFNTATGQLTGIPLLADVGSASNIVIAVSDGTAQTSLPTFSINILQAATGSATVSWVAPTQNTDGSALTDLASYRVVYGQSSTNLDRSADGITAGTTTYLVNNLTPGQWFFAVRAVNAAGIESDISNVATKTIN